jgi:hypothetical protein
MIISHHKKKIENIFSILQNYAEDVEPFSNKSIRLVAAVAHKYDIVALGSAKRKTHPMQAKYGESENHIHLHAEIDAMQRAIRGNRVELSRCSIFVLRLKHWKELGWGNARPCRGCQGAIKAFNMIRVYSIDSENKLIWQEETLNDDIHQY